MALEERVTEDGVRYNELHLEATPSFARQVIQKRLDFLHKTLGKPNDSVVRVSDEAYDEIGRITGGNPGFALYIMKIVFDEGNGSGKIKPNGEPYIVTKENVISLGVTFEEFRRSARGVASMNYTER
ncbi:hypothetical protein J4405_05050 [Candidatus Woesearchaeota archaeon]|nr:hypothetical protein [Candidatus Woesearchaeota archaeon]